MTLPRFQLPDESSSQKVPSVITANLEALDFDDLDKMKTRVLARNPKANVDDVVEELRAAAAGRSAQVRELTSDDLLEDVPDADAFQQVDVSELMIDRVVARRDVWHVHEAAFPAGASIDGPRPIKTRFLVTALAAMSLGALIAVLLTLVVWHFVGT
jgi:hypothetical protein